MRPRNPLNIGAAARAMANFGFRDLVVVAPYNPVWQETRSAVGAEAVVRTARIAENIATALCGVTLAVGTTSGERRHLDRELISLDRFPRWLETCRLSRRAALLFGSEKTGLSNEEMSHCRALVRIPTTAGCPSMNLGQAVAVCCFEIDRLRRASSRANNEAPEAADATPRARVHISPPASVQSLDHIFERATRVLDDTGYLKPKSRRATLIKLRRMLLERGLSNREAKVLGGVLAQIEWKLRH